MTNQLGTVQTDAQEQTQAPPPIAFYKGVRKVTDETVKSEQLLHLGIPDNHGVTLQDAWKLAKQVAVALGLSSADIQILDALFSFANKNDFTETQHPIVWPSNALLAQMTGKGVSAVKKSLAKLTQAGLIIHTASDCRSRSGNRNADGFIVKADGISLSPFITRFYEYKDMVATYRNRADCLAKEKRNRTDLIARIKSLISAGIESGGAITDWEHFQARLDVIRESKFTELSDLSDRVVELNLLLDECKKEFMQDDNATETISENQEIPLQVTGSQDDTPEEADVKQDDGTAETPQTEGETKESPAKIPDINNWTLNMGMIEAAIPLLKDIIPEAKTWLEIKQNSRALSRYAGIDDIIFDEGLQQLGADLTTAIVLLILQKSSDNAPGAGIDKPGAYMRALIKTARAGKLRLSQSFHALARRKQAGETEENLRNTGFPLDKSIQYTRWYEITKENLPHHSKGIHVDIVANAFRKSAHKKQFDLTDPGIKERYVNFCRKWNKSFKKVH